MTGTKTNERPGTRAQVKYVRSSAYKAREVLNLVRGKSYAQASEILTFSERRISDTVLKCLDSAAANAENNDHIPAEELFVAACYADEGPTLKRWRPRARGRATRIRKRTCHITVIVGRYTPEQLAELTAREEAKGGSGRTSAADARRRRVAKSSEREEASAEEEHDHDHDEPDSSVEAMGSDVPAEGDEATASDDPPVDAEADTAVDEESVDEESNDDAQSEDEDVTDEGDGDSEDDAEDSADADDTTVEETE